jgi:hypothetical protein
MSKSIKNSLSVALLAALALTSIAPAFAQYSNQYRGNDYGYTQPAKSANNNGYNSYTMQPLRGSVATIAAGTVMNANISGMVSTANVTLGSPVRAMLGADVIGANGSVVLPAGSQIEGQVTTLTKAGRFSKNGQLGVMFNSATLPSGQRIPIMAKIATADGTGILKGGVGGNLMTSVAKNTVKGTALGAIAGTALAPMAGGSVGKGAIYGTATGAGVGFLSNAMIKGAEAIIPSSFQIQLDQPVNVGAGY